MTQRPGGSTGSPRAVFIPLALSLSKGAPLSLQTCSCGHSPVILESSEEEA